MAISAACLGSYSEDVLGLNTCARVAPIFFNKLGWIGVQRFSSSCKGKDGAGVLSEYNGGSIGIGHFGEIMCSVGRGVEDDVVFV